MLSSRLNWVADRHRVPGDTRPPVPDYKTFDLTMQHLQGKGNWDFSASALNLFNATVLEPPIHRRPGSSADLPTSAIPYDMPTSPRTFWLQANYKL